MKLRPYQEQFIEALRDAFRAKHRCVLGVAPTGSGKTRVASAIVEGALAQGHRVLFAAGRRELIKQTVATLAAVGITDVRVIQAGRDEGRPDAPVIVGSVQTLTGERWLSELPAVQFGILDEAHHGSAATWSELIRSQADARWLGLTATPERSDGKPLGELFTALVPGPSVRALIDLGHLVPCRIWTGPSSLKAGQLAMQPLEAYRRFADGQRAGVFCRDVPHALAELERFRAAGIRADVVTGSMPASRRDDVIAAWRAGDLAVVTSVGVLTEGFDMPELACAILARRLTHAGQYLQIGGRIIRSAPGKVGATLVDLCGSAHLHGPLDLDREYSLTGAAIRGRAADCFSQCRACGSMFLYGPSLCPHCGAEIPTKPREAPRSVGADVTELPTTPRARIPWVSRLLAKREGYCGACSRWFPKGTPILWSKGTRARHQRCPGPPLPSAAVGAA